MKANLVGTNGAVTGQSVRIPHDGELLVGRGRDADFHVMDSKVSRIHCKIWFDGAFYMVEDLQSRNGTWLNRHKVESCPLFDGDRVVVGDQELTFQLEPEQPGEESGFRVCDTVENEFCTQVKEAATCDTYPTHILTGAADDEGPVDHKQMESDLSRVCRVINLVNGEDDLDTLFEVIMDNVMEASEADRGYLITGKDPEAPLIPLVSRHRDDIPAESQGAFSRSIVRECYQRGCSILRADPIADDQPHSHSIMAQHIQSLICVPMQCEQGVVGVIYVDKVAGSKKFTRRHLRVLGAIGKESGIAIRRAQLSEQVEHLFGDCIRTLAHTIEVKDEYTLSHSERVTEVAVILGKMCGLNSEELRELRLGGLLHDIGKIGIDNSILKKPGPLSEEEYEQVKAHTQLGSNIVSSIDNAQNIKDTVHYHHERWDGTGYPAGLEGEDIPYHARIVSLADAFDSMMAGRPYRPPLNLEAIHQELTQGRGTQFDPELVDRFLEGIQTDSDFAPRLHSIYRKKDEDRSEPEWSLAGLESNR